MGVGRDGMSVNMVGTGDGGLLCCHSGSEGEKIEEIRERRKSGDCFYFMISSLSFSLLCYPNSKSYYRPPTTSASASTSTSTSTLYYYYYYCVCLLILFHILLKGRSIVIGSL
jgi:hypothetical protein